MVSPTIQVIQVGKHTSQMEELKPEASPRLRVSVPEWGLN